MRKFIVTVLPGLLFTVHSLFSQMSVTVQIENDIYYTVSWSNSSDNDYYRLYKNGYLLMEGSETTFIDTVYFMYQNTYTVKAYSGSNDWSSDDSASTVITNEAFLGYPFYVDFEGEATMLASYSGHGEGHFVKTGNESYTGANSVFYKAETYGDSAVIYTPPFYASGYGYKSTILVSFYYKMPVQDGNSDHLNFRCTNGGCQDIASSETWSYFEQQINQSGEVSYFFTAISNNGGGVYIDNIRFENMAVGLNQPRQSEDVLIYPNPADDFLYLTLNESSEMDLSLEIYNSSGILVLKQRCTPLKPGTLQLDISDLPGGVYIIHVDDQKERLQLKFMVE